MVGLEDCAPVWEPAEQAVVIALVEAIAIRLKPKKVVLKNVSCIGLKEIIKTLG
jgi:hypothetical protein